jgi:hypothetical protein
MTQATTADRLWEKVGGICLIGAPLLVAIGSPFWFSDSTLLWAGAIQMYAWLLFIPALLCLARLLQHQAPRLAVVSGTLGIFGSVGGLNFGTFGAYLWATGTAGVDAATVREIQQIADAQLFPILNLPGIFFPISLLVLSIGLFQTRAVPRWTAILLGIGAISFPLGRIPDIQVLYHLSDALLLIPLGWIGLRTLAEEAPSRVAVPATT